MEQPLPKVSILIPTYNRPEFLPLIGVNIVCQDYPKELLEVVIIDDHPTNQLFPNEQTLKAFQDQLEIPVTYLYKPQRHLSIGEKRNLLVKCAKHKILINFDDDDLYFSTYIRYSVTQLLKNKVGMVGSNQMLFVYPHLSWKTSGIKCSEKRMIHEASMCYTKKHWKSMGGFNKNSKGEGCKMIDHNEKRCFTTDIDMCMVCICHKKNTIDKTMFENENTELIDFEVSDFHKKLIHQVLDLDKHNMENERENDYEIV